MNRLLVKLAIIAAVGGLLSSNPTAAQTVPPAAKAARVKITQGPALESTHDGLAIIRWTTNNPGGMDDHFAVVYYGTNPKELSQMAKNHIRLNRGHAETIFRTRLSDLKPLTTYYYRVTSTENNGTSDGVESPVNQFTTPAPGEIIVGYPPQPVPQPK
jgi:phosphodiesterase/alkaline phosphatase D-like protein